MKVRDILEKKEFKYREVITLGPNDTISAAIRKMTEYDRGSLPVCEESGELVGIVTERDVARKCAVDEKCAILKKVNNKNNKWIQKSYLSYLIQYQYRYLQHKILNSYL